MEVSVISMEKSLISAIKRIKFAAKSRRLEEFLAALWLTHQMVALKFAISSGIVYSIYSCDESDSLLNNLPEEKYPAHIFQ